MSKSQEYYEKGLTYNEVYQQGIADERERIVNLLKNKAWDEEEGCYLKFDAVLVPVKRLLDEIVRGGEND